MKEIGLTRGKVTLVDDTDWEYLQRFRWSIASGYAVTNSRGFRSLGMHRLLMLPERRTVVHHLNGNPLDNQRGNLVALTYSEHRKRHPRKRGKKPKTRAERNISKL